jgi:hypothetical protein
MLNAEEFFLTKSDFHKMKYLIKEKDKTYQILICTKTFFLSPEQTLLLSNSAFQFISKTRQPFVISLPEFTNETDFIFSFSQLLSLFENKEEIEINFNNRLIFQHLSTILENKSLESFCQSFPISQCQHFFLTSKRFHDIPSSNLVLINNFSVIVDYSKSF